MMAALKRKRCAGLLEGEEEEEKEGEEEEKKKMEEKKDNNNNNAFLRCSIELHTCLMEDSVILVYLT